MMLWSLLVLIFTSLAFAGGNSIDCNETLECPYLMIRMTSYGNTAYSGDPFYVSASVYDCCNVSYEWRYDLQACIISGPASFDSNVYQQCTTIPYYYYITLYYNTTSNEVANSSEVILLIQTQWPIIETLQSNISVMLNPPTQHMDQYFCYNDRRKGACPPGYGVPINQLNRCVQCEQYALPDWIIFVLIQLLPVTVVVLIIIVFNIQLTNGFMNGFVFYCQMISIVYPNLSLNLAFKVDYRSYYDISYCSLYYPNLYSNLFNLNFLSFVPTPLCITPYMTPLQAISFWYIIPTYPLVLLLLIYTWITMYDKGFRCVVTITRPLHRLLARFWRMINIEPCLIHSIASIYLLCFTQFAATSLQLLHPTTWCYRNKNDTKVQINYFGWPYSFAGIFAIVVLVFIIFLPMFYIQLYPFKVFHKLLSCLHLRKEILISLCDVFTGTYKDGSDNTRDYRYFAGFYLFLRIIVLCLYFGPQDGSRIPLSQMALFAVFGGIITIFRPYKRNIHSFFDLILMLVLATSSIVTVISGETCVPQDINYAFLLIIFAIIVFGYFPYWTIKKIRICYQSCKTNRKHNTPNNEEHEDMEFILVDDDSWNADRIEHPDDYDEHHVQYVPYDLTVSQPEENNVHGNTRSAEINNFETDPLSESDSWSILGSSNTIPLHSIVSGTQESSISNVNDEDEV